MAAKVCLRMNIYILRHGIAAEQGISGVKNDSERPLTPKGRRQLRKSAAAMKKMKSGFDLILSSPYLRAKQTAEIVAQELKIKKRLKFSDELKSDGNPQQLIIEINRLRPAPESLLLVGHEPYLSRLISLLVCADDGLAMDFKKGGLCKLEMERLNFGRCATLAWLLTPGQMKRMT